MPYVNLLIMPYVNLQVLQLLYDKDIIREEAILSWESEKLGADEADRVLLKQAQSFIEVRTV